MVTFFFSPEIQNELTTALRRVLPFPDMGTAFIFEENDIPRKYEINH